MPSPLLAPRIRDTQAQRLRYEIDSRGRYFRRGMGTRRLLPGPALTSLASGAMPVFMFVVAMGLGMYLHSWVTKSGANASGLAISPANTTQDA